MEKCTRRYINGGYIGISYEQTQDVCFNFLKICLPLNSTNGTTANIADLSSNNITVTNNSVSWDSSRSDKYYDGASSFDGSSKYLTADSTSSHGIVGGTNAAFLIESYVYTTNVGSGNRTIYEQRESASSNIKLYTNGNKLAIDINSHNILTAVSSITANQWIHVAAQRNSNYINLFVNGTSIGSTSFTGIITASNVSIGKSAGNNSEYWSGYIQDFKVYSGIAKYLGDFSPPAPATSNTKRYPSGVYSLS